MFDLIFNTASDIYIYSQSAVYEWLVQPLAFNLALGGLMEDGYEVSGWLVIGIFQIIVIALLFAPLEHLRPVEKVVHKGAVYTDMIYTAIHRLGFFRLFFFFSITPFLDDAFGWLHISGFGAIQLEDLVPGVTDIGWVSFILYLVVFDFFGYWIHRAQHQWSWWWTLHSVHHSQRQMTIWSDSRNHLLDDVIHAILFSLIALLIGIEPSQYIGIVCLTQLSESFQHANLKLSFGRVGELLWVSPRFHRIHHSVGIGHEFDQDILGGHNFAILLPIWDFLFRTSLFASRYDPTGIRDQVENNIDYGDGFLSQQWLGLKRFSNAVVTKLV
jgi:sterol desaturase/sphingolipid hydroxylase (fatty acid hydroxylase superfamily)